MSFLNLHDLQLHAKYQENLMLQFWNIVKKGPPNGQNGRKENFAE